MLAQRIAGVLLEGEGDLSFTTELDKSIEIDVVNVPRSFGDWQQQHETQGRIQWSVEIEARAWGIKEFVPAIRSFEIEMLFEINIPENSSKGEMEHITLKYPEADTLRPAGDDMKALTRHYGQKPVAVTIEWETRNQDYSPSVAIRSLEIDLVRRLVVVKF